MKDTCRHCGYFVVLELPKAPLEAGWIHTPFSPSRPTRPICDKAEPTVAVDVTP